MGPAAVLTAELLPALSAEPLPERMAEPLPALMAEPLPEPCPPPERLSGWGGSGGDLEGMWGVS